MPQRHRVARLDEIPPDGRGGLRVWVGGRPIALFRWQGKVYAIDDACTHEDASLAEGEVEDGRVVCPRHGARFDLATGRAVTLPAVLPVGTYPVDVEDGDVFVTVPC